MLTVTNAAAWLERSRQQSRALDQRAVNASNTINAKCFYVTKTRLRSFVL
jgi:hypothetical protein